MDVRYSPYYCPIFDNKEAPLWTWGNSVASHPEGCCWILRHFLTSYVISVASDIEREKSDKFCSEAPISVWGSSTYRKSTTRDPRLYFPSEGSHTLGFLRSEKIHRPRPGSNPRTSDLEANMITTAPPGSTPESSLSISGWVTCLEPFNRYRSSFQTISWTGLITYLTSSSSSECSAQGQVLHCKLSHQGCRFTRDE